MNVEETLTLTRGSASRSELSSPASQVCSGPSPSEPHLISPPKSEPYHSHARQKKCPHTMPKKQRGSEHRRNQRHDQSVSERDASNGEVQATHPCTPTCELQAKKENAADDRKKVHLTEGSPEVLTATRGLNLGAQPLVPADQH